jgi:hypothetical protein
VYERRGLDATVAAVEHPVRMVDQVGEVVAYHSRRGGPHPLQARSVICQFSGW